MSASHRPRPGRPLPPLRLLAASLLLLTPALALATDLVGTLAGEFSVDNHGAANYTIPLKLAPGRGGMEPKLALVYNSGSGNGPLGVGWSLSTGFPHAITRGRSILARDGVVRGVNFDVNDKFYLDGKRLICVSGTYGQPGSTYRTEVDSFVTITTAGSGGNIETFNVTDRNGVAMTFGKYSGTVDGYQVGAYDINGVYGIEPGEVDTLAYSWALKHVEDTIGNAVDLAYATANDGEYVLSTVAYTAYTKSPAAAALSTVQLYYNLNVVPGNATGDTGRLDQPTQYLAARRFPLKRRLDRIDAQFSGTVVARYALDYGYATNAGPTRLVDIHPSLIDPASGTLKTVPATTFNWSATTPGFTNTANSLVPAGSQPSYPVNIQAGSNEFFAFADVNGDGRDDFVDARSANTIMVSLANGTGFDSPQSWVNISGLWTGTPVVFKMCDINGDGRKDIVYGDPLHNGTEKLYALISTGTMFVPIGGGTTAATIYTFTDEFRDLPPPAGDGVYNFQTMELNAVAKRIAVADFTGDGRDDILIHRYDGRLQLLVSQGTSFTAKPVSGVLGTQLQGQPVWEMWSWVYLGFAVTADVSVQMMPCDLNGDGIMDYAWVETHGGWVHTEGGGFGSSDSFNQDKTLFAVTTQPDGTFSQRAMVTQFSWGGSTYGQIPHRENGFVIMPGDVNGDGLTDFTVLQPGYMLTDGVNDYGQVYTGQYQRLVHHQLFLSQGASGTPVFRNNDCGVPTEVTINGQQIHPWFDKIAIGEWVNDHYNDLHMATTDQRGLLMSMGYGSSGDNLGMADLNGDGRQDYYWYNCVGSSSGWYVMYSRGETFGPPVAAPVNWTPTDRIGSGATSVTLQTRAPLDLNGDGVQDYARGATSFSAAPGVDGFYLSQGSTTTRLLSVIDGLGRTTTVNYKSITDNSIYTHGVIDDPSTPAVEGVTYPIRELQNASYVVSDVFQDSGGPTPAQFSYQYSGNRLDLSGRGGLGFHSFVTLDRQTNLFKYQFLTQSFPMTGLAAREQTCRYWPSGGNNVNFRYISSHDNTVVFDGVVNGSGTAYGTLYPFISKAVESRWEDSSTSHFTTTTGGPESKPEFLFPQTLPGGAHITITAESRFDGQTSTQLTVPVTLGGLLNPSDRNSSGQNTVGGTISPAAFNLTTGSIKYGNLTRLSTDFGGGFTETVTTTYLPGQTINGVLTLTGLADTVSTSVTSPGYGGENAPSKTFTYESGKPLVHTETVSGGGTLTTTTTYTHDGRGRVTNTAIAGTDLQYQGQGSTSYTVSSASLFDDHFDLPAATQDVYGHTTTTVYDQWLGLPTSVTDCNGVQTTTQYDALARVVQQQLNNHGLQLTTANTYAWDATQNVGPAGTGGLGLASKYSVVTTNTVKPTVTTYYDRLGRAIRTIKEGFGTLLVCADTDYNLLGQTVAASLPYPSGGSRYWTTTTYDPLGRVATVTAPNGTVTTNTYQGRATKVSVDAPNLGGVDPAPQVNSTVVDPKGRTVAVWNADNVPNFTDNLGTTTTTPSLAFALDGFGRMRSTTLLGQSATITATYDALGRQTSLNDPDKGAWSYVNSALGHVLWQRDANLTETKSWFDQLGRQIKRQTIGGGATETANWYYYDFGSSDPNDPLVHTVAKGSQGWLLAPARDESVTTAASGYADPGAKTVHYYDAKGRPAIDLATIDGKFFYTYTDYDAYSRVSAVRHFWRPAGHEAPNDQPYSWQDFGYTFTYDSKSYLTSLTDSLGRPWWDQPSYDHLDRLTSVRKGGAYVTARTYRPQDGVLTGIQTTGGATYQNLSFSYDGLGNLTQRAVAGAGGPGTENLTYDILNRLTNSSKQGATTYVPAGSTLGNGNIQTKVDVSSNSSGAYTYDTTHPHAVHTAFGYTMGYDANGNVASRTKGSETWSFRYAGFDKPRWMIRNASGVTKGSEFLYNANRSRVIQLMVDQASGTAPNQVPTHYSAKRIYAMGSTLEVNYTNPAGQDWTLDTVRIYVPGPDGVIGAREFRPAVSPQEKALVYHYDHLGSIDCITKFVPPGPAVATDPTGKPGQFSEDAWGQRRDPTDWQGPPTTTDDGGADSLTPRGYTGHEMLDDLGLVHMNGRIYDPVLGRFLSADVLVQHPNDSQDYNRYSYVRNNPLRFTDPSGFEIEGLTRKQLRELNELLRKNGSRLEREILKSMRESDRKFTFKSIDGLRAQIAVRVGLVEAIQNFKANFGTGRREHNPDIVADNGRSLQPGKTMADYVNDHFGPNASSENRTACNDATNLAVLKAVVDTEGPQSLEKLTDEQKTSIIRGTDPKSAAPFLKEQRSNDQSDWIPGDIGYVKNMSITSGIFLNADQRAQRGENLVYLGGGQFAGFGPRGIEKAPLTSDKDTRSTESWQTRVSKWQTNPNHDAQVAPGRASPTTGLNQ